MSLVDTGGFPFWGVLGLRASPRALGLAPHAQPAHASYRQQGHRRGQHQQMLGSRRPFRHRVLAG
ncbi:hypothetical protein BHS06_22165 [Myxococcus xanthus]|nr:hypothetical protein BHS06_22165 [Myxococcus xanthus]